MPETGDLQYCMDIHGDVSRTFELASNHLSGDLKNHVVVGYEMCRIPDTVEDSGVIPEEDQEYLLDLYSDALEEGSEEAVERFTDQALEYREEALQEGEEESYWELIENTDRVMNVFQEFDNDVRGYVRQHVGEMVQGMQETVRDDPIRIQSTEDFENYCFHVAGTVGNLLTDLFSHNYESIDQETEQELNRYAEDFGEGLQTVNIVKDVKEDYQEENAIFLPEEILKEHGNSHEQLQDFFENEEASQYDAEHFEDSLRHMVDRSEDKLEEAANYIKALPENAEEVRDWTITTHLLAVATLREADRNILEPLEEDGVKISKTEAGTITELAPEWRKLQDKGELSLDELVEQLYQRPQEDRKIALGLAYQDLKNRDFRSALSRLPGKGTSL